MASKNMDPKVTEYIDSAEAFAKPILKHIRQLMHENCPEVVESVKWGTPHFDYNGDFMCAMAAFKGHCSFTFLKSDLMTDPRFEGGKGVKPIQRFLGRIKDISDLPSDAELATFIKEAVAINDTGVKLKQPKPKAAGPAKVLETPQYFLDALAANPAAKEVFDSQSATFRKNYIVWLDSAKTEKTRQSRVEESVSWIAEGKGRFWKYEK